MKFIIGHKIRGRVRIHLYRKEMSIRQADLLQYYLCALPGVKNVKVYERTADVVMVFKGDRGETLNGMRRFSYENERPQELVPKNSGRALNRRYKGKLIQKVAVRAVTEALFPLPFRAVYTVYRGIRYLTEGICCLLKGASEMEILDAAAITVSAVRGDFDTAGSVMFLLGAGELLEEWTHGRSVGDLARSMSPNITEVWQGMEGTEVLVPLSKIRESDTVTVRMGNVIPLGGVVVSGEAMVNQASLIGESIPVKKEEGMYMYVGTAIGEGEITPRVKKATGATRFERIVTMIGESEQLKSTAEGKAATLANALIPWSLGGTVLTWLLARNPTKALSILMVDFSCALKLAVSLSVPSAMHEVGSYHITVKDDKYMEIVTAADTIIFDKTGTLIKARPRVADMMAFNEQDKNELLRIAACLEEHFLHSMANAVVQEAVKRGLVHQKIHSGMDYIVAHGIVTYVGEERVVIGSYHFVFEGEGYKVPEDGRDIFDSLPPEYFHLFLTIGGRLAAVIRIEDPLREEANMVISALHRQGIKKIVMMTGDSERTARAIAAGIGVDEYYSEVLPKDEAGFVEREKRLGHKVIIIGDGINDSPALSAADAGIAISERAETARGITDIIAPEDDLFQLVTLRVISRGLMNQIGRNYRYVIGFNLGLIPLDVGGVIAPATSALLHSISILAISLKSIINLLD